MKNKAATVRVSVDWVKRGVRVTKAMLEEENRILRNRDDIQRELIVRLKEESDSLKHAVTHERRAMTTMTIALEKISEASAHVIADVKRR